MMQENFEQAKNLLEQSQRIVFTTHERTDGDDLGSVLALANHLKDQGKEVTIAVTGGVPSRLEFLPLTDEVQEELEHSNYDLLVISGCSNLDRVNNPSIQNLNIPTINFDHHPDNQNYATVNVVQSTKSSVAELVYDFFVYCNWPVTSKIATCLLTGIITDTGLFMHSNTQAETLQAASELMRQGARITQVTKHTFSSPDLMHLRSWGKGLENSYFDAEKKVIYSVITTETLRELGNPELASFEGLVETLNKVPEAKYAMILKEEGGKIKGSLRGDPHKGVDVREIAQKLGGGGHKWAAGFSLLGQLTKDESGKWGVMTESGMMEIGI